MYLNKLEINVSFRDTEDTKLYSYLTDKAAASIRYVNCRKRETAHCPEYCQFIEIHK
jgi:hypothetical protein